MFSFIMRCEVCVACLVILLDDDSIFGDSRQFRSQYYRTRKVFGVETIFRAVFTLETCLKSGTAPQDA
jgi:hypothetical protein